MIAKEFVPTSGIRSFAIMGMTVSWATVAQ